MAKLCEAFRISPRRSCELVKLNRTIWYYKSRAKHAAALAMRLRYGCQRLYELLRREGWHVDHKRVHRLSVLAGLQDRIRRKIERASHIRAPLPKPSGVNEHWSMDFMHDVLDNGRQFRILTMVDKFSRESPLGEADFSMDAGKVITCLERLKITRGLPQAITADNSTEFYSRAMDSWAYRNKAQLDF